MKVYHTSTVVVNNPDTEHSRKYLDFGSGFYITTFKEQAIKYGARFLRRNQRAFLNTYDLIYKPSEWDILSFEEYNKEWLDFVAQCRAGESSGNYDMVVGGIANDKVILTLDLYFSGTISEEEALKKLKYEKPNIQYCIRSQRMLNQCVQFLESQEL